MYLLKHDTNEKVPSGSAEIGGELNGVARHEGASPATGSLIIHQQEQQELGRAALG